MKFKLLILTLCVTGTVLASPQQGCLVATHQLAPKVGVIYHVQLRGGEKTVIDAHGTNTGGDIDCVLYKSANVIVQDMNKNSDACHMELSPAGTDTYDLVVVNNGKATDTMTLTVQ